MSKWIAHPSVHMKVRLLPGFIILVALAFTIPARAETYDVNYGTFEASEDFVFKHTGTVDSFRGPLVRKTDGFTITFDVGAMAGSHMHDEMKAACTLFRSHKIGGLAALTGIEWIPDGQRITTTIAFDSKKGVDPANFWADFHKESDIAEFMLIVTTYKPKAREKLN